jgi:hypothetical protein
VLAGCAAHDAPAPASTPPVAAWVELAPEPQARAVVDAAAQCPQLQLDARTLPMHRRAAAGSPAARPSALAAEPAKAAVFPVQVCELDIPPGTRSAQIAGRALPLPKAEPRRIVVLGDTGCRAKGNAVQRCQEPDWPFARVAALAATWAPDLVVHVGDYHYRETPCRTSDSSCRDAPWGYGWDAWRADFFDPARPLLAAAPWVVVRGNHEACARAGQGWFRLLAPEPYVASRTCDEPRDDATADVSAPYGVALGAQTQLIVFDSAVATDAALDPASPRDAQLQRSYDAGMRRVAALSAQFAGSSWFVSHHPVLAFASDSRHPRSLRPGNPALQESMHEVFGPRYYPDSVQLALHGHVHLFQALEFASPHPATLVAGNGGDVLDAALPQPFPSDFAPAAGVRVAHLTQSASFGFLVLERSEWDPSEWSVQALRTDASTLARCTLTRTGALSC